MATARTPRHRWVDQGLRALAEGGPDAVRVEALARSLGATKGSFYWHFDDRGALLDEMLATWERLFVDEVIDTVEAEAGEARDKLHRLYGLAASNQDVLPVDLAIRDWARREPQVAQRLRRVDNRRMDYMRSLYRAMGTDEDDVEVRCMLGFSLWIGNHFIAADHGSRTRAEVMALALRHLES